jgi:hypothetical protein
MVALSKAWTWIQNKGLVTQDPSQATLGSLLMTRLGRRVIEEGLAPMYAEERLQMELHPRLEPRVGRQFLMGEFELAALLQCEKSRSGCASWRTPQNLKLATISSCLWRKRTAEGSLTGRR